MREAFPSRRQFLSQIGQATLAATIGPSLAVELGMVTKGIAEEAPQALNFGALETLVTFMQETPVAKLQSALVGKLQSGESIQRLLAAGALANARSFGGEDYIGFHTLMAMSPALKMSGKMAPTSAALPVLKVLYRNTNQIQTQGGRAHEVLHVVPPFFSAQQATAEQLHKAVRGKDQAAAEQLFGSLVQQGVEGAFEALLACVEDNLEVHRTVLPYRAWDLLPVVGPEHAQTLLRQSLRYCLNAEGSRRPEWDEHGKVLTRLLDEHHLLGGEPGDQELEDGAMDELSQTIFQGPPEQAAGAVAAALAAGIRPADVGEAISLAANQLLLRDHGRPPEWEFPGKPTGSVHGDSIGVHASDSANAWRNLARISQGRNTFACLILGAWQTAESRTGPYGKNFLEWEPVPTKRQIDAVTVTDGPKLLDALDGVIRQNLQSHASALVHRYGLLGLPAEPVFQLLLGHAVSEDGALHAEKYYQTCWDEFHTTRAAFRWRHLTGLARVTASEYGRPAPGQAEARELLKV